MNTRLVTLQPPWQIAENTFCGRKKMAPNGSGTIRRCGFIKVDVDLLEEVLPWG